MESIRGNGFQRSFQATHLQLLAGNRKLIVDRESNLSRFPHPGTKNKYAPIATAKVAMTRSALDLSGAVEPIRLSVDGLRCCKPRDQFVQIKSEMQFVHNAANHTPYGIITSLELKVGMIGTRLA